MDTRFNSFYSETPHSFVVAMTSFLEESGLRALRPSLVTDYVYRKQTKKYYEDIDMMRDIAFQVIERRKSASIRKKDLVDAMIHEKDPGTGQSLPHENIINNMITFLIAGDYCLKASRSIGLILFRPRNHIWFTFFSPFLFDQEPSGDD
jgi:cytochrome P450/NADPH-cytochrome P450 reductase